MNQWMKHVERIRLETGLPIVYRQTSHSEAERVRLKEAQQGWELAAWAEENETVSFVLIESSSWHASARALLGLFFSSVPSPSMDNVTAWLQSILSEAPAAPPPGIEQLWSWREKRAVFLIERSRSESVFDWQSLTPLLHSFFVDGHAPLMGFPLKQLYYLLLVPLSMLGNENGPDDLLEWAAGLRDLLSTERMEPVRLMVSPPIATPLSLDASLSQLYTLSRALTRFHPRIMVAGTWHYPLEQWAVALPPDASQQLARSLLSQVQTHQLGAEQIEILETFFRCHLNISDTARQLFLHRNTLLYRLDKLAEQTGLDPRQFSGAVLLKLALLFRQN